MNDYWNYLAHGELGKERKGHKYYARVAVGRNKLGFTQYRYFYDAREYGAYMTRKRQGIPESSRSKIKGRTVFTTGTGKVNGSMKGPSYIKGLMSVEERDLIRSTGNPTGDTLYENGKPVSNQGVYNAKTVKDHPNLRKAKQNIKSAVKKGKKFVSGLVTNDTKITMLSDMDSKTIKKYFSGKKKGKNFISSLFSDNTKITMLRDMDGKSVKKYIAGKK